MSKQIFSTRRGNPLGNILEQLGMYMILLFFWLPWGWNISGDPYFFDFFQPDIALSLPVISLWIILVFLGKWINHKLNRITYADITFISIIIGTAFISSLFAIDFLKSLAFLMPWLFVLITIFFRKDFDFSPTYQWILCVGVGFGYIAQILLSEIIIISSPLLGVMSLVAALFLRDAPCNYYRSIAITLLSGGVFLSGNIGLIIFAIIFWVLHTLRIERSKKSNFEFFLFPIMLVLLTSWSTFTGDFLSWPKWQYIPNFTDWIVGVGDGNTLIEKAISGDNYLNPTDLQSASVGPINTIIEKGVLGLMSFIILLFYPSRYWNRHYTIWGIFAFGVWILAGEVYIMENGVLTLIPLLWLKSN